MTTRRSIANVAVWDLVGTSNRGVEGTLVGTSGISAFIGQTGTTVVADSNVHLVLRGYVKGLGADMYQHIADLAADAPTASSLPTTDPGPRRFRVQYRTALPPDGSTNFVTSHAIGGMSAEYGGATTYTMRHGALPGHTASDPSLPDGFFEFDLLFNTWRDGSLGAIIPDLVFSSSNTQYSPPSGSKWGSVRNITYFNQIGTGEANESDFWNAWPEPFEGQYKPAP